MEALGTEAAWIRGAGQIRQERQDRRWPEMRWGPERRLPERQWAWSEALDSETLGATALGLSISANIS